MPARARPSSSPINFCLPVFLSVWVGWNRATFHFSFARRFASGRPLRNRRSSDSLIPHRPSSIFVPQMVVSRTSRATVVIGRPRHAEASRIVRMRSGGADTRSLPFRRGLLAACWTAFLAVVSDVAGWEVDDAGALATGSAGEFRAPRLKTGCWLGHAHDSPFDFRTFALAARLSSPGAFLGPHGIEAPFAADHSHGVRVFSATDSGFP